MAAPPTDDGDALERFLQEDLGPHGDVTSSAIFAADEPGHARMVAREELFTAGLRHAVEVFERQGVEVSSETYDGSWVQPGAELLRLDGPVRGILVAERLALNMVARMSGVATMTRVLQEQLTGAGSQARVAATRKTTPGFRSFEKEAVRLAGGDPHRAGLWDAAMVKDNHIAAAGGIEAAVEAVRAAHQDLELTVEVESLQDALAAAKLGADWLLIDNQDAETGRSWAQAVWSHHPDIRIEASGGIQPESITDYGWADRISLGVLTNGARAMDVGLDWGA